MPRIRIRQHPLSKLIKAILLLLLPFALAGQDYSPLKIYTVNNGDSALTKEFVKALCNTARYHTEPIPGKPTSLERLILVASNANFNQPETPRKTRRWHTKFGAQARCQSTDEYPEGSFLRQIVLSNYRDFANIVGPKNRLSLDLTLADAKDGRNIFEFINHELTKIEARHDNRRFEFQRDIDWQNIMFFYFLFSEYKINYDAKLKE